MHDTTNKIPNHIGIIVDGNGRWAESRKMPRTYGHSEGAKNVEKIARYAISKGINILSFFIFSTENFKRDKTEVDHLMNLLEDSLKKLGRVLSKENIKIIFSGRRENLNESVLKSMDEIVSLSHNKTGGIINFCLNYGGRKEILDATVKIHEDLKNGIIGINELTEEVYSKYLYQDLPDLDLVIRTSGEMRVSNFMLYQLSYAELYFPTCYFPDFNESEFDKALEVYRNRDRRFGGIKK